MCRAVGGEIRIVEGRGLLLDLDGGRVLIVGLGRGWDVLELQLGWIQVHIGSDVQWRMVE